MGCGEQEGAYQALGRGGGSACAGVALPFAPAVPEPSPLCPAPPSAHLCLLFPSSTFSFLSPPLLFLLLHLLFRSSWPPSSSCPLPHPFFRLSFPPLLFGATALRLAPAPASLCPVLQPPPSVLQAWGPCPPHSWGAGSAPCPSLCRCFGDPLVGGGGELGSIWVLL